MVFSSHLFVYYFLPSALALYYLAPRRARHLVLTIASYLFYGWANPLFMPLMLASTLVDYFCGLAMTGARPLGARPEPLPAGGSRSRGQRIAVTVSIVSNLSLLGFFKYFNFAVDNYNVLLMAFGLEALVLDSVLRVALPLGISFYTFQSMSYSIDVYRGHARALTRFIDFACYVSLFPQLVAGPIIRFSEIADQLESRIHSWEKLARGAAFLSLGMAKKVLLANPCGKIADVAFEAASLTVIDAWLGALAYAFQIYFDFSGYSDMAIGLGLMLGFVFPKNFDSPYKADSITDFWRRWHLSLSTWLRDYLYIPLGGSRLGPRRTYVNLGVVMLLGGLWHGAAWTFVLWGGYHGVLLAIERSGLGGRTLAALPRVVRVGSTFLLVLVGWVLFRSTSLGEAIAYLGRMTGLADADAAAAVVGGIVHKPYYLATLAVAAGIACLAPQSWDWTRRLPVWKLALCLAAFWIALGVLATQAYNPFIYFIF